MKQHILLENIIKASHRLNGVAYETPLQYNLNLSERFDANVYLKREDLQVVRSYKIRGAYNLMSNLSEEQKKQGVVCASAGNHAQGVAYSCELLQVNGVIYMPTTTPSQKVRQVQRLGKDKIRVVLDGDDFDTAYQKAISYSEQSNKIFVPPFEHPAIIEGQGTVGLEIYNQFKGDIDFLFMPIGGGGLSAGVGTYLKTVSPATHMVGVEPQGAPAMYQSRQENKVVALQQMDTFVDGAAVRRVGDLTFDICSKMLDDIVLVAEGKLCTFILQIYNQEAIVVEPAGVLSIAALDHYKEQIKGKNVVCVVSGGNNDIQRMPEIKERSLIYEGLKHYFIIQFPQRAGALREFLDQILGPDDDIAHFQYTKKTNRASGPALVGIELKRKEDYTALIERMEARKIRYTTINDKPVLFNFLI